MFTPRGLRSGATSTILLVEGQLLETMIDALLIGHDGLTDLQSDTFNSKHMCD